METFANFWAFHHKGRIAPSNVVDLCLRYLREDLIPREMDASQAYSPRTRMAFASIHAMSDLDFTKQDTPVGPIVDAWPGISKWISFVFSVRVASGIFPASDPNRHQTIRRLVLFWHRLLTCDRLSGLLVRMPMAPEISAYLWRESAGPLQPLDAYSGSNMFALFLARVSRYPERQDAFARSMGSDVDAFADTILRHFSLAIPKEDKRLLPSSWQKLDSLFIIISQFSPVKPLLQALLSLGIVTTTTTTFSEAASICYKVPDPELEIAKAALGTLKLLLECFAADFGRAWFMEAVREGFLDGLCAFSSHGTSEYSPGTIQMVQMAMQAIYRFLVYGSAIEEVTRAIPTDRDGKRLCVSNGPLKKSWDNLFAFIEERSALLEAFKEERAASRASMVCNNSKVRDYTSLSEGIYL